MILFWIFWVIDAVIALIAIYFFIIGLMDGSVSSFNSGIWTALLISLFVLLGLSFYFRDQYLSLAKTLLGVLAIPALLFGVFMLVAILTKAKWN